MSERLPLGLGNFEREWQGSVHNPQTGHDLDFEVLEYSGGLSLVRVQDPTKIDVKTGEVPVQHAFVRVKPVDSMTREDRREFCDQVRAIAEKP